MCFLHSARTSGPFNWNPCTLPALSACLACSFLLSLIMIHCAGCHCNFSVSGYTHHLRLTQSSSCAAAYQAQLGHENDDEIEEYEEGVTFPADFFGDYEDDDRLDGGMSTVDIYLCLLTIVQVSKILLTSHQLLSAILWPRTHASRWSIFLWPQQVLRSPILYMAPPALRHTGTNLAVTTNTHLSAPRWIGT
jgi:hypothetical protein